MKIFLFLLFLNPVFSAEKAIIRDFKTDICTGWKDGTKKYDWAHCCIVHDLHMWAGGTKAARKIVDKKLRACVKEASNGFHAGVIYYGVKTGKMSPVKLKKKRWGHAWKKDFRYSLLSISDIKSLERHLHESESKELNKVSISEFIKSLEVLNPQN